MSITQEQYDALKPGDRVTVLAGSGRVIAKDHDEVWVSTDLYPSRSMRYTRTHITAIIPPAPQPVAWVNLDADRSVNLHTTRERADVLAYGDRTHIITIYGDGTTTTEAVS